MTKYVFDARYGFDGSDVEREILVECIEEGLNATVDIEEVPDTKDQWSEGYNASEAEHSVEDQYMEAELKHATALLLMCLPLVEAMIGVGSSARGVLPDVSEFLQHHGFPASEYIDVLITKDVMLFLNGFSKPSYRCESCGSNVFSKRKDERGIYFECHGCLKVYREGFSDATTDDAT